MALAGEHLANEPYQDRIHRPRLQRYMERAATVPITVLVGAAGCGKSDLIRSWYTDPATIYFRVGNERRRIGRFVQALARAIAAVAPQAEASFPRAWERSLQSRSPAVALAHWLCEHLEGVDHRVVIDNLHDAAIDTSIASFIATLSELRQNAQLTISVRSVGALPIGLWMATRRMQPPIDGSELNFDRSEVAQAAEHFSVQLSGTMMRELLAATNGLPVAVAYALTRLQYDSQEFRRTSPPASFGKIAETIFARRTEREQQFLFSAALMPRYEDDALRLLGWEAPEIRRDMSADAAFIWETDGQGSTFFHDRFRDYLEARFQICDMEFRATTTLRIIESLTRLGRQAEALEIATREPMVKALGNLLDAHGFAILESGQMDIVSEALEAVEESSLGATGLALRGHIDSKSGRLDTAEAWFRQGLDKAQDEATRSKIAVYYAGELAWRRRTDACDMLEAVLNSTSLPRPLLMDLRSSYAQALAIAGRLEEAHLNADEVVALLDNNSSPVLRARVLTRAAFVAMENGQHQVARERALVAAPLAVAHSLYELAAFAYGILYNIAYDFDDDVAACMEYLRCKRDMAVKLGFLRIDLWVLLAMYELHAEAGDEAALADSHRQLDMIDKHYAAAQILEVMTPSQALQAAWTGSFDEARRLLMPTAEHQGTAVRRALCWAQVGLYSAAAGDAERTSQALLAAEKAFEQVEQHETHATQFGLCLLTLALASVVSKDLERARAWMDFANDAVVGHAPRLHALRATIEAMIVAADDPDGFAQRVPRALAQLRAVSFGGMAKLIEALPFPLTTSTQAKITIGSALADRELSARFATAVKAEETAGLWDWLDTVPSATFTHTSIAARFEQWASVHSTGDHRGHAGISNVRRELAAYRQPPAAKVDAIDDIDASIDILFKQLEASSPLMAEHSRAVAAWCARLARTIGLSESEIAFMTRCGLIHDIGKIWTPPEILNAPRGLTPDEWVVMRAHTTEGSLVVECAPLLGPFAPIVRGHHERLDGKGYPDGLPAEAIPLAARIVAVADCFNAMIGRRMYRPAMRPTEALSELARHRGTQFDPEVVDAMTQIVLGRLFEPAARSAICVAK